jgi:amino-acid N-acetyltransferase
MLEPPVCSTADQAGFIDWFRQASPYIHLHRGKTFVVCFGGEAVADPLFSELVNDIALLHSLGIRLVLAHGARPQIEARLADAGVTPHYAEGLRITDETSLPYVKEATGRVRIRIEARLSMSLANSPMHGARIRVASGNFVTARPLGVRDGVDYCFTGEVRRIDNQAIKTWLDSGAIVLLSSLGYSPTGEIFNISAEEVATAAAASLRADKLLLLYEGDDLRNAAGELIRELGPADVERLLASKLPLSDEMRQHLRQALRACRAGVRRIHLLRRRMAGGLLLELFSRDGVGSMVNVDVYENLRSASIDDVGGILALIRPLEDAGILVRRSRELLEVEIGRFVVLERDNAIIGCAALYSFPDEPIGELACVAVDGAYQNSGRADALLKYIETQARRQGLRRLFVLTTRTAHWFLERGFQPGTIDDLPVKKQTLYNWQRASKVFVKLL